MKSHLSHLPTPQPPSSMRPVVGDIVQFVYQQRNWAAIVTHVVSPSPHPDAPLDDMRVNLYVFPDATHNFGRDQTVASVVYDASGHADNTWHWLPQALADDGMEIPELMDVNG